MLGMALELVEWDLDWWNGTWTGGMGLELVEWDLN